MVARDIEEFSKLTAWAPIGPGIPLTLDIREVYTGAYPQNTFFADPKSMLITSAVKSIATFEAKPRAINFLTKNIETGSRITHPPASEQGTPYLFYSPALLERSLTLDLSIVFDEFPKEIFSTIGNAFKSAAGLPIFLSHSIYLIAVGEILRIAGEFGESMFDGKPVMETSVSIDVDLPGTIPAVAGFMLVVPPNINQLEPDFLTTHQIRNGTLIDQSGNPYNGEIPYIILSVDGTKRDDLAGFAPTAASSAILSQFFGVKEGQPISLTPLMDALKIYNDFNFRSEIDRIDKTISTMKDGADKDQQKLKREALLKNITTEILKP